VLLFRQFTQKSCYEPPHMSERSVSSGLSSILDRVGEFFHIFDLSYFVGGVLTLSAASFAYFHIVYVGLESHYPLPDSQWLRVIIMVISSYACGLVAFAIGRLIGTVYRRNILEGRIRQRLTLHGIDKCPILKEYVEQLDDERSSA
jgi:hypothetical protein